MIFLVGKTKELRQQLKVLLSIYGGSTMVININKGVQNGTQNNQ
jgi:hypothetical protein